MTQVAARAARLTRQLDDIVDLPSRGYTTPRGTYTLPESNDCCCQHLIKPPGAVQDMHHVQQCRRRDGSKARQILRWASYVGSPNANALATTLTRA